MLMISISPQFPEYFEQQVGLYDPIDDTLGLHMDFIWPGKNINKILLIYNRWCIST